MGRFSTTLGLVLAVSMGRVEAHDGVGVVAPATVRALHTGVPIVIDGRLDDAPWKEAAPADTFRQRDPEEGQPATERTAVWVAYDEEALYLAARLFDSEPKKIGRRLSRRDDTSDADRLTVFLDPRHDHLTGAIFTVSAAGVQSDAVLFNDSWDDSSWDAVWESAVSLDEEGWAVEMRIPFSQLRFAAGDHQRWGINVERYIQRKNERDWLELVPKTESGLASRMAHLTGLEGIEPRRHLALLPYAVARSEFVAPSSPGDPFNDGSRLLGAVGLDVKYGLGTNLTLDSTLNPDFGQVEVDPAVVNLTDFETFFEEKRPFFIEGNQIFGNFGRNGANNFWGFNRSTPDLFYSRRIGRIPQGISEGDFVDSPSATTIVGATKITGKTSGGLSLGILEAVTAREWADVATGGQPSREEVEPLTNYFVGRAFKELPRGGYGFLTTFVLRDLRQGDLRDRLARDAFVGGVDGYVFLDRKKDWVVTGGLALSHLAGSASALEEIQRAPQRYFQRPDAEHVRLDPQATSLWGWTGDASLNRQSGRFRLNAALWATSPGFESNDLGFNFKTDRWGGHIVGEYRKTDPDRLTRRRFLALAKWYTWNFGGETQGNGLHVFGDVELRNYWTLGGNAFKQWRTLDDALTRGGPSVLRGAARGGSAWVRTDSRKPVSVRLGLNRVDREFRGWSSFYQLALDLKPLSSVSISLGPSLLRSSTAGQWVQSVPDATATDTFGSRYVFAELEQTELAMTLRLNWILSPKMSLQIYAQPLLSVGDYRDFKELARPRSFEFRRYGIDAGTLTWDPGAAQYTVDPDGIGPASTFAFGDPDFNFKSLRMNAIFRWEFRPGSTLYVAWTQTRADLAHPGDFDWQRDAGDLLGAPADDVFLVKVAYSFGG